jgi:hypothetical protein
LKNGTHDTPAYYVFDPAGVTNFRRLAIEIRGGVANPGVAQGHWELNGVSQEKIEAVAVGGKRPRAMVMEEAEVFTAALRFERGRGHIIQLGLFTWLLTPWWE